MKRRMMTVLTIMMTVMLIASCTLSQDADLKIGTDGSSKQIYTMTLSDGSVRAGVVPAGGSVTEKGLSAGDAAITYHSLGGDELKRVAVVTVGKDREVILSQKEAVPSSVYAPVPAAKTASRGLGAKLPEMKGEWSFYIFNDDGTGWKTTVTADLSDPKPSVLTLAIGWKSEGSIMIISENGRKPIRFTMRGDAMVSGELRWQKGPQGEPGEQTLDDVWTLFDTALFLNENPSMARLQLSLADRKVRILGQVDATSLSTEDMKSEARADVDIDLTSVMSSLPFDMEDVEKSARFSTDGGLCVINVLGVRIPLIRAKSPIVPWTSTTSAPERSVVLSEILDKVDNTKIGENEGKPVYLKDAFALVDTVAGADGTPVDISGKWKAGDITWDTCCSISMSSDDRIVLHVPDKSGFHAIEVIQDKTGISLKYHGWYSVSLKDGMLSYSGRSSGSAEFESKTDKTVKNAVDAFLNALFGEGVTSDGFALAIREGKLVCSIPDTGNTTKNMVLSEATVEDSHIGFRHKVDTDKLWEILGEFGIDKILTADPSITYDVVFPLKEGKVELLTLQNISLTI